jgi:hypothetical protein
MDKSSILKKTDKGRAAMADKSFALSRLARTALIMIDGVKSVDSVMKVLPGGVQAASDALDELLATACVEFSGGGASGLQASMAAPTPSGTSSALADPAVDAAEIRRAATKRLAQMLGPFADDACMAIERSKDVDTLRAALEQAARAVQNMKGRAAAEDFLQHTRARLG